MHIASVDTTQTRTAHTVLQFTLLQLYYYVPETGVALWCVPEVSWIPPGSYEVPGGPSTFC